MSKIVIELNNEHQPYKLSKNGDYVDVLTHAPGSTVCGNDNPFYIDREDLTDVECELMVKTWFNQGFVDYSPKSEKTPLAANKVYIPIRRVVEIHIL
jgi:hypothetical protein